MPRTISLVLVILAERVAQSLRGFVAVVTVGVDGLGQEVAAAATTRHQNVRLAGGIT